MQRNEVEAIFQERKEKLLQGITPSTNPIAIIMGGQPACGKSFLLEIAKSDNIDKKFSDYPFMHLLYSQLLVCQRVCLQNTVCLICK